MSLRIGIDFRAALTGPCGISRYARELSRALLYLQEDLELVLYAATRFGPAADLIPRAIREHPRVHLVERRLPARALRALSFLPGFHLRRITGPMALLHHTDLTFLPTDGVPEVVTVHDLAYEVSEEFHEAGFRRSVGERVRRATERARAIIVPSETTRRDLEQCYGVSPERITVIPHGADHVLRRPEDTDHGHDDPPLPQLNGRPYLLHVGTIEPRKNLPRLLRAFARIAPRHRDVHLVLAGPRGWKTGEFDAELASHPQRQRIHQLQAVSDTDLRALYSGSVGLVYPSLYEGFGLPVVEAMALGRPVLTSARSSTAEIAADAALLVDPEDEDAIGAGMEQLLGDESGCRALGERGREVTRKLTWQRTARETFEVYRRVLMEQPSAEAGGSRYLEMR